MQHNTVEKWTARDDGLYNKHIWDEEKQVWILDGTYSVMPMKVVRMTDIQFLPRCPFDDDNDGNCRIHRNCRTGELR